MDLFVVLYGQRGDSMFLELKVKNFRSIKEEVTFSMVPTSDDSLWDNVIESKENALRTLAVYGANASGKTNLMRAFTTVILAVRNSNFRNPNDPIPNIVPFKFDDDLVSKPSFFEITFLVKGVKYIYSFSADSTTVYEESLKAYYTQKPYNIFHRTNTNQYKYNPNEESLLSPIEKFNAPNKMFLATASAWNYEKTKPAFDWLEKSIDTYEDFLHLQVQTVDALLNDPTGDFKDFTLKILQQADLNISDYDVVTRDLPNIPLQPSPHKMIKLTPGNENNQLIEVFTQHRIFNNDVEEMKRLELAEESFGTQQLFSFTGPLKNALDKGRTIFVDELDKSLHPFLVRYLIEIFNDPDINKNNAQLIFTTHDTYQLSLDYMRRDQIFFTEKNQDTGATDIYSLADLSVRKGENIQKGYLLGRYGAIPYVHVEELL